MERTGADPIRDDAAGGELARETDAELYCSPSDPPSPGVSGRLKDEILGRLERVLDTKGLDEIDWLAEMGGGVSFFGVLSTTRRTLGCRGAGESDMRDIVVNGVLGREPSTKEGVCPCALVSTLGDDSDIWAVSSDVSSFNGFISTLAEKSLLPSPMGGKSFLDWLRDLLADFGNGEPSDICEPSLTRLEVGTSLGSGDSSPRAR